MSDTRSATVHYRKLVRESDAFLGGASLSRAVSDALHRLHSSGTRYTDDWKIRVMGSESAHDRCFLVNDMHFYNESVFGTLCAFSPGQMQALISAGGLGSPSAPLASVGIDESQAPGGYEYLSGIAYWLIIEDHCYMVQHVAIKTKSFENYLNWLLRDDLDMTTNETITLQEALDVTSIGGDLDDVKSVEIGGFATTPKQTEKSSVGRLSAKPLEVERSRSLLDREIFGPAVSVIENLLGPIEARQIMNRIPDEAALEVKVKIGYKTKHRLEAGGFMGDIASAIRNIEGGEITIRAKNGVIRGEVAWLQRNVLFRRVRPNSALLDLADTRSKLVTLHRRLLEDRQIS